MKSPFILAGFSFLALFAGMINARKDGGEYWEGVKKDENNCGTTKNFEPRPNISAYTDESKEDISLGKDFEPRPNVSAYTDESKEDISLGKDFEPRPNGSAYNDKDKSFGKDNDDKDNLDKNKSFVKYFEPRPNVSSYNDDGKKMEMEMEKGVQKDIHQSQPSVSV